MGFLAFAACICPKKALKSTFSIFFISSLLSSIVFTRSECNSFSTVIPDLSDSFNRLRNLASLFSVATVRACSREYFFSGVLRCVNGVQLDVDVKYFEDRCVVLFQQLCADLRTDLYSIHDGHFGPCDSISHDMTENVQFVNMYYH